MSGDEEEPKSNYFFHKCLKDIFKNIGKPLFNLVGNDSHEETDNALSSSKSGPISEVLSVTSSNEPLENNKKPNSVDLRSWKECFFFSNNDTRLKDGVIFFKCINNQNNQQFNEVRKKLKQSIRHKMMKRRTLAVKRKFNKRNFNRFMYKKIK